MKTPLVTLTLIVLMLVAYRQDAMAEKNVRSNKEQVADSKGEGSTQIGIASRSSLRRISRRQS